MHSCILYDGREGCKLINPDGWDLKLHQTTGQVGLVVPVNKSIGADAVITYTARVTVTCPPYAHAFYLPDSERTPTINMNLCKAILIACYSYT